MTKTVEITVRVTIEAADHAEAGRAIAEGIVHNLMFEDTIAPDVQVSDASVVRITNPA